MRFLRVIFAAALALLFVVSTNSCALAAAFAEQGAVCCEDEADPGSTQDEAPCGGGACAPCASLVSGVNLTALIPLTLPAPLWTMESDLTLLLRTLASAAREAIPFAPPDPVTIPSPPWAEVATKAQPVRGPSLVA